ncbi:unnamed protein product [Hymenolepis diminuta]|uniref:Mitochondrial import inner membrane translocase subunit n=1 Tax=Hymenolepis diminuta TaxID=6216 RepID=A0A564Z483_HYMDI|nr:unnamed protein product [Hymenolepis diminuta]
MNHQKTFEEILNGFQIKEMTDLYVKCGTVCFNNCVNNMTARKLNDDELNCITRCTEKFAKMNQRLSLRLLELNQMEIEKQQQQEQQK